MTRRFENAFSALSSVYGGKFPRLGTFHIEVFHVFKSFFVIFFLFERQLQRGKELQKQRGLPPAGFSAHMATTARTEPL